MAFSHAARIGDKSCRVEKWILGAARLHVKGDSIFDFARPFLLALHSAGVDNPARLIDRAALSIFSERPGEPVNRFFVRLAICVAALLVSSRALAANEVVDLRQAVVVAPADLSDPEKRAVAMLLDEVDKRVQIRWQRSDHLPTDSVPAIVVGQLVALNKLKGLDLTGLADSPEKPAREGYHIIVRSGKAAPVVFVIGNDARGVLFGVGRLLRALRMERGQVTLPANFQVTIAPQTPLRGHQLGYRPKTNSYDGWTVALWEQYLRDLAVFGTNAVELIPPRSDDAADSPHFPLPPLRMMTEMSRLCDDYGLDVWIWYPAMDLNYANPKTVEAALKEWGEIFQKLPRIDAVFVPGGDPGHTSPDVLFALLEKQTANLRRYHPNAQMWMSPQSFTQAWLDDFFKLLDKEPAWLAGIVHGPQLRMSLPALRARVPKRYPIRDYPDITHSRHCQYPVPDWDLAFAATEGREVSNPRPTQMAQIFRVSRPHTNGFLSYSEGCHDDVNKIVWSALGWDEKADVREVLREYSRYFIGPTFEERFADGLLRLEKNWEGPVLKNTGIDATLREFQALERDAQPAQKLSWRFQHALYRAYYDAYVHARLKYETELETAALAKLGEARRLGSIKAMAEAEAILDRTRKEPGATDLRARVFELAEALFQSIRMQLSVPRYQAIAVDRGANLDTIDFPLNNAGWLKKRFTDIRALKNEGERLAQLDGLLKRTDPGPGGFYDNLGDPEHQPHLVRGEGFASDPAFYASSLVGFGFRGAGPDPTLPTAWWKHAESLFDAPLKLCYTGLDPAAHYRVRVVYGQERRANRIRFTVNDGLQIHDYLSKSFEPLEYDIPAQATASGELTLIWNQQPGSGGAGRGCQVCEVWLLKK
jgi:hypothetical protein